MEEDIKGRGRNKGKELKLERKHASRAKWEHALELKGKKKIKMLENIFLIFIKMNNLKDG
jgi:hypothetical protein